MKSYQTLMNKSCGKSEQLPLKKRQLRVHFYRDQDIYAQEMDKNKNKINEKQISRIEVLPKLISRRSKKEYLELYSSGADQPNSLRKSFESIWEQRYRELFCFWKLNGHCNVPQRYDQNKSLGKWVHKQRQELKKLKDGKDSPMTKVRVEALCRLGFQANTNNRAEALWHKRYAELIQFRMKYGHCNVPQKFPENFSLGKWVHRQRYELKKVFSRKHTCLTLDRIEALDALNFQ